MAYERRREGTKNESNYEYVVVNEDEEYDSDSSDTFFNGPRKKNQSFSDFSPRFQVALCVIFILALVLFVFVIYNFLKFIIAFQNAMDKLQEKIPLICQTAYQLNSKLAHRLSFCPNATATPATNVSAT